MNKIDFLEKCKNEKEVKWDGTSNMIQIKNRMMKIKFFISENDSYDWSLVEKQLKNNRKVIA